MDQEIARAQRMRGRSRREISLNEEPRIIAHSNPNRDRPPAVVTGARIKTSALGAVRLPRLAKKEGIIVGNSRLYSSVRVLFDGCRSPMSLHRGYIEEIQPELE
jgi:hypothetical protein